LLGGDPYLPNEFWQNDGSADSGPWHDGWDYEPGSYSGHNWYTGPGGPRMDRAPIPSILALWASDPNGYRLAQNVPWKDMARASIKAYHNHSNHWVKNPNRLSLEEDNETLMQWRGTRTYYDSRPKTGARIINIVSDMRSGEDASHKDKNGRFVWSGWGRDGLHSYGNAGWGALLLNSPKAAIASKWDSWFQFAIMSEMEDQSYRGDYMVRSQAWRWLAYALAWKNASSHRLGLSREQIEAWFGAHLTRLYNEIYVPVFVNNEDSEFARGIRNLGVPIKHADNWAGWEIQGSGLGFYMAGVLALMKQTGLWSAMYAKGGAIKTALDMQLRNMDTYSFGRILDTPSSKPYESWNDTESTPTSWADYSARFEPKVGQLGWFRNADGTVSGDREVNEHPRIMYPYIRRDYFPEFPHPRLAAAVAETDFQIGLVTNAVNALTDPGEKRNRDHAYGYPGVSPWKAPAELGPA
jgi:hypothetical protein